jgi:leucyl-tRNA synthetase
VQYYDAIFENELEDHVNKVRDAYEKMVYRDVIKHGLHDFSGTKDLYLLNCDSHKPRHDLIERYIYLQLIFLYPICPHFCEIAYLDYFLPFAKNYKDYAPLLGKAEFPKAKPVNYGIIRSHQYFLKFMIAARDSFTKVSKPRKGEAPKLTRAMVIYRERFQPYQVEMLKLLKTCIVNGDIRADWRTEVKVENKEEKTKSLKFAGFIEKEFKTVGEQALE